MGSFKDAVMLLCRISNLTESCTEEGANGRTDIFASLSGIG